MLAHNQTFSVSTPDAASIDSVALMRMGSVTHNFDMDQRYIPLTFRQGGTAGTLSVDAPANPNVAPPGRYMLFILKNGVPSVASLLTVSARRRRHLAAQPARRAHGHGDRRQRGSLAWTASTDDRGVTEYRDPPLHHGRASLRPRPTASPP